MAVNSLKNSSTKHFSLFTLLLLAIAFFAAVFYVKPLWDEVSTLSQARDQKASERDQLGNQVQQLQQIQQESGNVSEVTQISSLNAIPERFEQDLLVSALSSMAQGNDLVLNNVNFGVTPNSAEKIKKASLNINVTSTFDGLISFLRALEASQRKMIVRSVTVQAGQTDSGIDQVNFNVNVETYYQDTI